MQKGKCWLDVGKNYFSEDGQAQKQAALWGCGISIHGNDQNLTDTMLYNLHELQSCPCFEQRGVDQIPPQVSSNMNYS